ncbi:histidine phosphotransferase family protein [Magnetovibrio sp. PR-2]|uniref:histidine phosphotransferase family protein n=1 Tax=Magnetovibrio sp. PR-2 TaxID=3120356 RepID=UPI002FCE140D
MQVDHRMAQLLVSRVCHDLAGGISAISTGTELIAEEASAFDADALNVIAMSAKQSADRLSFYRVAFGLGGGENDTITTNELKILSENFLNSNRLSVDWGAENTRIGLMSAKLLMNLCLLGAEALPRGGVLRVDITEIGGRLGFAVSARGQGAGLKPEQAAAIDLECDVENLTARTVNGYFSAVLAQSLGGELEILPPEGDEIRLAALL